MGKTLSRKSYRTKISPVESEVTNIPKKPLNILVDLLMHLSAEEELTRDEISRNTFTRHLFREYPDLSHRLYNFLANEDSTQTPMHSITKNEFQDRIETVLNNNAYETIFQMYFKMYCGVKDYVTAEEFYPIVAIAYNIFMDNNPQGPQICPEGISAVQNLIEGLFHKQPELKVAELQHLIERDCPYLIYILHSYVTYKLSVASRELMESTVTETEVVQKGSEINIPDQSGITIPLSKVWSLATVLPRIYMHPYSRASHPKISDSYSKHMNNLEYQDFNFPSHWCLLYSSTEDGNNPETLLSNLLHYKGPTMMFILGKRDKDFCVCISEEWREAPTFWGDTDCCLIQFSPVFRTVHKGPGIIYINFNSLGGHQGIQIGNDATNPTIVINSSLDRITYNGKKTKLQKVEVWGCGAPQVKEMQLEIKQWNSEENDMKAASKSFSSWNEHQEEALQKDDSTSINSQLGN